MASLLFRYSKRITAKIIEIAKPLIYTNISRVIMGLVDMMMVGRILVKMVMMIMMVI